jgi:hypothetical protein
MVVAHAAAANATTPATMLDRGSFLMIRPPVLDAFDDGRTYAGMLALAMGQRAEEAEG